MTQGSNFWVIGGEFGSMNFHKLVEGSAQVQGPFKTRKEAEDAWRVVSEENRHKAGVRFSIVEEPARVGPFAFRAMAFSSHGVFERSGNRLAPGKRVKTRAEAAQAFGDERPLRTVWLLIG